MKTVLNILTVLVAAASAEFIPIAIINGTFSLPLGLYLIVGVIGSAGIAAYFLVKDHEAKQITK